MNKDLIFISGNFNIDLPKEKKYLLKYFDTPIQEAWLLYLNSFGDAKNFVDHTGVYCAPTYFYNLNQKLIKIEEKHKEAKSSVDLTTLAKIESGKFIIK